MCTKEFAIFFILSSAFVYDCNAQSVKMQFMVTPTYCDRFLRHEEKFYKDFYDAREKAIFSFDAGVLVNVLNKNRFSFYTGAQYSRKGYANNINAGSTPGYRTWYNFTYLEIPLKATFGLGKKGNSYIGMSILNDIFAHAKYSWDSDEGIKSSMEDLENYRRYVVGLQISVGHSFQITEKLAIGFEPTFKVHAQDLKADSVPYLFKHYLYSFGISAFSTVSLR